VISSIAHSRLITCSAGFSDMHSLFWQSLQVRGIRGFRRGEKFTISCFVL
jgi:hypothetical protein